MSQHKMMLEWRRGDADFTPATYPRAHTWRFEGGQTVQASAAPAYHGDPNLVDPEEAFVASIAACHMLTFLAVACKAGHIVDAYVDDAVGTLEKNSAGRLAVTRVGLRPRIDFAPGQAPSAEELATLHHRAHEHCFIANSVRTVVEVEPIAADVPA